MKLGIFFAPGAARGAYGAGVAQALINEGGLHFDLVAGTSVGALNGAFVASGQVDRLVEVWKTSKTRDILGVDWKGLAKGAVVWSRSLLTNMPQKRHIIDPYLTDAEFPPGVRLRCNLDDLQALTEEFFEWPGAPFPITDGVHASMAMVGMIVPFEALGTEWCDGGVLCGNPLEEIALSQGIDRLFVVGVAPRSPMDEWCLSSRDVVMRTSEWSQFSETLINIQRAREVNDLVTAWAAYREAALDAAPADGREEIEQLLDSIQFPYSRPAVDIVEILPEKTLDLFFIDYSPPTSTRLVEIGYADGLRTLASLG